MNIDEYLSKWIMGFEWQKPTHGRCCSCQKCGRDYDTCNASPCTYDTLENAWQLVSKLISQGWSYTCLAFDHAVNDGGERLWEVHFSHNEFNKVCKECNHFERFEIEHIDSDLPKAIKNAAFNVAREIERRKSELK